MKNVSLKTEWRKLIMINYEMQPSLLEKYIPKGTELDSWKGKFFISVVGFKFINIDFNTVYGKDFNCLTAQKPSSVFLVEGSEVLLGDKQLIT